MFNGFAKLLSNRLADTGLDQIDIKGLVLTDYRIDKLRRDDQNKERELHPMKAGTGQSNASRRQSLKRIVAKLNETWGDNVNVVAAARAVNFIIDYVDTDQVTHMRITNSTNSKESLINDGRLKNQIKMALVSMVNNETGNLAAQIMNDPQAIASLADQIYDQIAKGSRYNIPEIQKYVELVERSETMDGSNSMILELFGIRDCNLVSTQEINEAGKTLHNLSPELLWEGTRGMPEMCRKDS